MSGIKSFVKQNPVMCVALLAAAATACFVPPDREYLSYFDFRTLTCLFCVLAVVCALKNIQFFYLLARKVVECFGNLRRAIIALVYITFLDAYLVGYLVLLQLILDVSFNCFFVSPYCIYEIPSGPEMSVSILVLEICVSVEYHQAAFSL